MKKRKNTEYVAPSCPDCGGTHYGSSLCPFTEAVGKVAVSDKPKPTIAEIEALLNSDEEVSLEILPNGEIRRASGKPTTLKPLTFRERLGGEYAA